MVTAAFIKHSTPQGKQASEPVAHIGTAKEDAAQNKGADKGSGACRHHRQSRGSWTGSTSEQAQRIPPRAPDRRIARGKGPGSPSGWCSSGCSSGGEIA